MRGRPVRLERRHNCVAMDERRGTIVALFQLEYALDLLAQNMRLEAGDREFVKDSMVECGVQDRT